MIENRCADDNLNRMLNRACAHCHSKIAKATAIVVAIVIVKVLAIAIVMIITTMMTTTTMSIKQ